MVYISPHIRGEKLNGKGDQLVGLVLEEQQRETEVVVMGDFNAHFDNNKVALDPRAGIVQDLARMANLTVRNWQPGESVKGG